MAKFGATVNALCPTIANSNSEKRGLCGSSLNVVKFQQRYEKRHRNADARAYPVVWQPRGDNLLAGAISQQALDLGTIEALLGLVANGSVMSWQHISGDNLRDSSKSAPKIGRLNRADNLGIPPMHKTLAKRGLSKPPCRFSYLCWNLTRITSL
jgi:hypothetical protein